MESQVDWLTLTVRREDGIEDLLRSGFELTLEQVHRGNKPKPWGFMGYIGSHCGSITYGDRQDGAILQITGQEANEFFGETLWLKPKCTRIDLQVTATFPDAEIAYAANAYRQLRSQPLAKGRPTKGMLYANTDGGMTCYVGSPASDHRGRIYDKWRESNDDHYKYAWRWEVESRAETAEAVFDALATSEDRAKTILGYVGRWFESRGITVPLPHEDCPTLSPPLHDRSDTERKLEWLREQVSPTVRWLCGQGRGDDVTMALSLPCREMGDDDLGRESERGKARSTGAGMETASKRKLDAWRRKLRDANVE